MRSSRIEKSPSYFTYVGKDVATFETVNSDTNTGKGDELAAEAITNTSIAIVVRVTNDAEHPVP